MNGGVGGGGWGGGLLNALCYSDTQRRRYVQDTIVYRLTSKRLAAVAGAKLIKAVSSGLRVACVLTANKPQHVWC